MATATKEAPSATANKRGSRPKAPSIGPIRDGETYSLDEFQRRTRWSGQATRTARANGLRITLIGNICFIRGADFNDYVEKMALAAEAKMAAQNDNPTN